MIKNPHPQFKLLENHDDGSVAMTEFANTSYVDMIGATQALYNMSAAELGDLRVKELMKMIMHLFEVHPEYIQHSVRVRNMFNTCHPDCHALRIQHYMRFGYDIHSVT